jgi:glycine oxidase
MSGLSNARVVIAGAGVLGSSIALELARAGAAVVVVDPAPLGDNASGVAAGMLAPAFEAVLDEPSAGHFSLLLAARDLWPAFAASAGIELERSGALWASRPEDAEGLLATRTHALEALGPPVRHLSPAEIRRLAPGIRGDVGGGVLTTEDWRLAPGPALAALSDTATQAGARLVQASLIAFENGAAVLASGEKLATDLLVVATGAEAARLAPELAALTAIKGHILHFGDAGMLAGSPVVRCQDGYVAPTKTGLRVGATMEPGVADRRIDDGAVRRLHGFAADLFPHLTRAPFSAYAAVRAATPDGLPLVGASSSPGVVIAAGARRNGWLLAPLVARLTAAYLAGRDPGPHARALAAGRFLTT